jgi:hypothetical protein
MFEPDHVDLPSADPFSVGDERFLTDWMKELRCRSWSLRRPPTSASGLSLTLLRERCRLFLGALIEALRLAPAQEIGAPEFREPVQILSVLASWIACSGGTFTDAVAVIHGLRAVWATLTEEMFQSLVVVMGEAFCATVEQQAQSHFRDAMSRSQVVCAPHPRLPCLFLVGDPDRQVLDDALERLLTLGCMRDAATLLIDVSGLLSPERTVAQLCEQLEAAHLKLPCRLILAGLSPKLMDELTRRRLEQVTCHEDLSTALAEAAGWANLPWPGHQQ